MSLLSVDITKVKRLSLREVKLPAPERRVEPVTPIQVERPPTDEEIAYSKLVAINPVLKELVDRLDLVSINTNEVKKDHTPYWELLPVKPLYGYIAELEDKFVRLWNKRQPQDKRIEVVRLLDKYKRITHTEEEFSSLEILINKIISVN